MSNDLDLGEMKEIIDDFLVEADELLHSLDANLVKLEATPGDLNLLNEIFRAAHTIKGTSSFLGFEQVTNLTHKMEDILNKLRKGEMVATPAVMDLLLESLDILKVLIGNVHASNFEEIDIATVIARLEVVESSQAGNAPTAAAAVVTPKPLADVTVSPISVSQAVASRPVAAFPEASPDHESSRTTFTPPSKENVADPKRSAGDQTIRVDVNRLDALMNLMGELVLGRNAMVQTVTKLTNDNANGPYVEQLNQAAASLNYITAELQMAVMKMRMQPIGKVFGKFPRLVRDLSRESGKQIELVVSGEETELDKSVIEEIGDPLVHVIRNSCDHGIEMPDVRAKKGKSAKGVVSLAACQQGSNIVIRISDDGKGLDVVAIRDKAVERGLATRAEVDKMADREVFRFIFEAGLSTAKVVTGVSGRGVGMDVVRTNIEKLNGLIELDSKLNHGTTITIKLPLTLAILQGLLIESDSEVFILPLSSVIETVRTTQSDISYINRRPVLRLREDVIPIIDLSSTLGRTRSHLTLAEKPYVVVVGLADKKLGINIDRFLGQEEVVIKSLGSYLGATEGVAGATILGDGRIRLIVDLLGLFSLARKTA